MTKRKEKPRWMENWETIEDTILWNHLFHLSMSLFLRPLRITGCSFKLH